MIQEYLTAYNNPDLLKAPVPVSPRVAAADRCAALKSAGLYICFALLGLSLTACAGLDGTSSRTYRGPLVGVGNGTAHLVVVTDHRKTPVSIGIALSEAALTGLPSKETVFELDLPAGIAVTPFSHATLDWNPHGHVPAGVYDLPHFDFHFYMISREDRGRVRGGPDKAEVAADYVPQDYISTVDSIPNMGVHWVDAQAPELNGQSFSRTFLYGFSNGKMSFIEPMITTAFLHNRQVVSDPVKQPRAFQRSGRYPLRYGVRYDQRERAHVVSLEGLMQR